VFNKKHLRISQWKKWIEEEQSAEFHGLKVQVKYAINDRHKIVEI
jgi:hypothetical protein